MRDPISFIRLLPTPEATSAEVYRLLDLLSPAGTPRPLVFEAYAGDDGIRHFIGRDASGKAPLRTLIRAQLPGSLLLRTKRPTPPDRVARLKASPRAIPLSDSALEATLHALYGALAGRRNGETIALQVVFGRGYRPMTVPAKIADPAPSLAQLLLRGGSTAPTETRKRVSAHAAAPRIEVTVRVGVSAATPERRRMLRGQLLGALAQLEAPGTKLSLTPEPPNKWVTARPAFWGIPMSAAVLTPLLCWPVDGLPLPGLPPQHPKLLPPPKGVTTDESVFAVTTAPGIDKQVGLTSASRLQHLAITGGTGSGKSQIFALLSLADITAERPLVLIEPKRQLVDAIVARASKEAIGRIVVIDAADDRPVGFNPLDIGDRDPGPVVDGILEVFKTVFADGWGPRTEDLLHVALHSLCASGMRRGKPHTLLDLLPLISDDGYRRSVIGAVADDPTLATYWATFNGLSPAHRASITAAPLNKLRKYVLRKNIAAILGQPRPKLRLRDIWKSNLAVLVPLNDALIGPGAAQLLGGLIVSELWLATQERALEKHPQKRPGMVFVDEVQRYLHLPTSIDDALATSRSYGVGWHLAAQGRSQLPKTLAFALELNARNQITFAASPNDATALAKTTTKLTREDFQSLGRFEIYANLVVDGAPAGWFSARTLPPRKLTGQGKKIRAAYRAAFGADPASPQQSSKRQPAGNTEGTLQTPRTDSAAAAPPGNQRKRRRP
ncbi:type IV secretory system conjugative DNA transfer family protein [Leucobacter sp. cx-328]|uniref:type IV secretory system conjugative DNA transfer family protein n=1 Tax=unclassified Leucobacter TaxID=2621730 RepID=UPI00165DED37|nr:MULTISPECIES: type IV secretory system conjugative DNA transfer family protein [unclassified Leucobacter]MBC9944190.1 type IV secretory system conjugative DNA transfer family protein [Leucobacter sp. cx-328]